MEVRLTGKPPRPVRIADLSEAGARLLGEADAVPGTVRDALRALADKLASRHVPVTSPR